MRIGIDLLWVRPGICGGTESFIRNLMEGFGSYDTKNEYVLFASEDNVESFRGYEAYSNMKILVMPVESRRQPVRILWENLHLDRRAEKEGIDLMYIPVYSKPLSSRKIPYVNMIHDIQAMHYPQYFGTLRRLFLKRSWRYDSRSSGEIVTISDYCLEDLKKYYPRAAEKMCRIYIPVKIQQSGLEAEALQGKYAIQPGAYFYCVSSMLPHKNLDTLLQAIALRKKEGKEDCLVISGVGGNREAFQEALNRLQITENVIDTGFVSDAERDLLYENCRLFLFPSIFEGFGMPVIEAMGRGKITITTRETCLEEVTQGRAVYVDRPLDAAEWAEKIKVSMEKPQVPEQRIREFSMEAYRMENVIGQYLKLFEEVAGDWKK